MFAFEWIASELVIELFSGFFPMDKREIRTIVFEVATNTILPVGILHFELRVIAAVLGQELGNFFVAIKAAKCWRLRSKLVATRTLRSSTERLVRFCKRTRRNLRRSGDRDLEQEKD
jgi:hypothetical protein